VADELGPVVADGDAQEGVHFEDAGRVDGVLGERGATAHVAAAEDALRRVEGLALGLAGGEEGLEDLEEVGAVEGVFDRDHPLRDAPQPPDVDRRGENLRVDRDPLPRLRGAWCAEALGQASAGSSSSQMARSS
jgi:hypothetical protein